MNFRTEIQPLDRAGLIDHESPVMLLGSCFSDNIGAELSADLFDVLANPLGTLYNPASILSAIERIADRQLFTESDLFMRDNLWVTFDSHSSIGRTDKGEALETLNNAVDAASTFLGRARIVIITLGTAWVFRHTASDRIVANCHKVSAKEFTRFRLSVKETTDTLRRIVDKIHEVSPQCHIIFTVSPIRHKADGLHGNNLSKATLHLAVEEVMGERLDAISYFPAYEAVVDDLRDYRFYATDMCHPSEQAVKYVYELFAKSYFTEVTRATASDCRALTKLLGHRPLADGADTKAYHKTLMLNLAILNSKYPQLNIPERATNR